MKFSESSGPTKSGSIGFGVGRKTAILQVVMMAYFLCYSGYKVIAGDLSVWSCYLAAIFAISFVLSIWQLINRQSFGGMDDNGITLHKQTVSWDKISEVRLYPARPSWLYSATPQRVYAFVTDQLPDEKLSRWKSRFFRNSLKRYGTAFVISEMLVLGTDVQFKTRLQHFTNVPLVRDPTTPDRAKWYDFGSTFMVVAGFGLLLGITVGIGAEPLSVKNVVVLIVDAVAIGAMTVLWRLRIRKLRATAPNRINANSV